MKTKHVRTAILSVAVLISLTFAMNGLSDTSKYNRPIPENAETHAPGSMARLTSTDGTNRTVQLDGFGCTAAICSRVFIKARTTDGAIARIWIDHLAAIRDIAPNSALFVMKDGTQQRLSLITDFRVLYMDEANTRPPRTLDLSKVRSLEMLGSAK